MIAKDFKIDFEGKRIYRNPKGGKKVYTLREFYSFLQDIFDEAEMMRYDIPIVARSKTKFSFINGWAIDEKCLKYLEGIIEN